MCKLSVKTGKCEVGERCYVPPHWICCFNNGDIYTVHCGEYVLAGVIYTDKGWIDFISVMELMILVQKKLGICANLIMKK